MNIGESLGRNAQHFPDKRAIVDAHRSVSYAELHERTDRLANYLTDRGVRSGDLVGLSIGSRAEHFEALFAIGKIGAVAIPFDFNWSAQECHAMMRFFAPKAFFLERRNETKALLTMAADSLAAENLVDIFHRLVGVRRACVDWIGNRQRIRWLSTFAAVDKFSCDVSFLSHQGIRLCVSVSSVCL